MRVLLDACVPERLAGFITGHEVEPLRTALGSTDFDDGPVLDATVGRFDAFVTVDKNLRLQQNLRGRVIRIVLLRAHSNALEHLVPLVPALVRALAEMQPGDLRVIGV